MDDLELILDGRKEPGYLPIDLFKSITKQYSTEVLGNGGFGVVYKGLLKNGTVAVKKAVTVTSTQEKIFDDEVKNMMRVKHPNVVRFLGYCSNTETKYRSIDGKFQKYDECERLLCVEYMSKGSLKKYIKDELRGLGWHTRFQIIKGICEGLRYLHEEIKMTHRDLKPDNILLDDHMVPKISDLGISKLLDDGASKAITADRTSSLWYCSPEFREHGLITNKLDIYSLGVIIIELVTGSRALPDENNVLRRWRYRWNKSAKGTPSPLDYQQVARCIKIGLRCKDQDRKKRPTILSIIGYLNEMDSANRKISNADESTIGQIIPDLLGIEPLELYFPFEVNKQISCTVQLSNDSDDYIAFIIEMPDELQNCTHPNKGVVPPRSKFSVEITLPAQEKAPEMESFIVRSTVVKEGLTAKDITESMFEKGAGQVVDEVELTVVYDKPSYEEEPKVDLPAEAASEMVDTQTIEIRFPSASHNCLPHLASRALHAFNYHTEYNADFEVSGSGYDILPERSVVPPKSKFTIFVAPRDRHLSTTNIDRDIILHIKTVTDRGVDLKDVVFKAVYANEQMPEIPLLQPNLKALCQVSFVGPYITSVNMHRTEPWILFVYDGTLYVWNYNTSAWEIQAGRMQRKGYPFNCPVNVDIAKFNEILNCIVGSDSDGNLYQYNYRTHQYDSMQAHAHAIKSMVFHPTKPIALSSDDSGIIKIWNWGVIWTCIQIINGHSGAVVELKLNPLDDNTFASASSDGTVKIWNLGVVSAAATLDHRPSKVTCVDFVTCVDKPWLISGSSDMTLKVWDYRTMTCLQTLEDTCDVRTVCCHPKLPIIFSGLADGTVRVWNSTSSPYRIENSFAYSKHGVCATYRRGSRWVIVAYKDKALLLETHGDEEGR